MNEAIVWLLVVHGVIYAMQGYFNDQWNPLKMYSRPKKGGK